VLFNVPFTSYGETVRFRAGRAVTRRAATAPVAALVRAGRPPGLRTPHTGALQYASDAPKIPAAAISTEDADRIERMTARNNKVVVRLKMEAHFEADAESANVVGEIRGASCRRRSLSSAGTSIPGTSAPARPTMAAAAW
jgi:carboxypeptidase Q